MFVLLTIAIWLGIYALRSYVPSAVWNMADELPLAYKPTFAVLTHLLGMCGILVVRRLQSHALSVLTIAFALVTVARQIFIANDNIGPWLSLLSWVLWLWFMMSLADEVAAHDAEREVAPAFAAALAMQVGMQAAWHGLDLQSVRGPIAIAASVVLAGALCYRVMRLPRVSLRRPDASLVWIALGIAIFLEVTFLANVGRIGVISGWTLAYVVAFIQIALLTGIAIATRVTSFKIRVALIVVGFTAVFGIPGLTGAAALFVLFAAQLITICGVREAAEIRIRWTAAAVFTIGALLLFALIFAFYNAYEMPSLWIASFATLAVAAGLAQRDGVWLRRKIVLGFVPAFVLALMHFVPPKHASGAEDEHIRVLSYNIHHGFNDDGVPGMQRTATAIAGLDADVIALQEIGRGWTLLGGNDLVAYLQWRLPGYAIYFAPTNGQLWGNAIMSRRPMRHADGESFRARPGDFRYGFVSARIEHPVRVFDFISVHLSADLAGPEGDTRDIQAQYLLNLVRTENPVIVAGDFNALSTDAPVARFQAELTDLGAAVGLEGNATWPATIPNQRIDYIFARGFTPASGSVPQITTSDHLPVFVRISP